MRKGGRPNSYDRAAIASPNFPSPNFHRRPDPPASLTEPQAEIWRQVVRTEDAKFFATGALQYILEDFCRHREAADRLNELINKSFERSWVRQNTRALARLNQLLKMRDQETRAAAGLATKLRLTNQSRYVPDTAARAAARAPKSEPSPWEFTGQ